MELESTDKTAMVYETLKNIKIAINRLEERNVQVHSIAHHYFDVDAEEVFNIIKNDLDPLKKAIDFFMEQIFPKI